MYGSPNRLDRLPHMSAHSSKRSISFTLGPVDQTEEPLDEVEYIRIAADLLQQMFSELRSLAASNTGLARALFSRGVDVRARLWTLHETVESLNGVDDLSMAIPLSRRATSLISWLSDAVDELALCATGDDYAVDAFRDALH
jgi:hypothetical protein